MVNHKKPIVGLVSISLILIILLFVLLNRDDDKIVLHYAAWNLGKEEDNGLERQMIKRYMQEHSNIEIVIDEAFVTNYDKAMAEASASKQLPDVFMYSGNAAVEENNWCMDISEIVQEDEEWQNIPMVLQNATYIKGKTIAIPSAMYLYGYFCNKDVLKATGCQLTGTELSLEEFVDDVKQTTNLQKGYVGLGDMGSICEWYPAAVNPEMGYFSWDGGKFNLDSKEFVEGMKLEKELITGKYAFGLFSDQELQALGVKNDWEAWAAGKAAFREDGTWSMTGFGNISDQIVFVGIPNGRTCVIPDFLFLAQDTKHPKEAYEFAKYLSAYSKEGLQSRIQIAKENKFEISTLPMCSDKAVLEQYFSLIHMKGIKEAYSRFMSESSNSFVEMTKILPGYTMARWNYVTKYSTKEKENATIGEVLTACAHDELSYEDVAKELNYLSNSSIEIYPQQLSN